ncbi:putative 3'-5' exonuclease R431, partial [Mucuna pruriens]
MASVIYREHRFNHVVYTVDLAGTYITVTVTASASVIKRWISSTLYFSRHFVYLQRLVVGLGVQWTPGGSDPPPDTLQLCVGRRCLIVQLRQADGVPESLRTFLNDPSHTFVGFWNYSDRKKLKYSEHELEMRRDPVDLRRCIENLTQASVEEIVEKCLGYRVLQRREISMSAWYHECLSNDQVAYATVDAHCAFLIGYSIVLCQPCLLLFDIVDGGSDFSCRDSESDGVDCASHVVFTLSVDSIPHVNSTLHSDSVSSADSALHSDSVSRLCSA